MIYHKYSVFLINFLISSPLSVLFFTVASLRWQEHDKFLEQGEGFGHVYEPIRSDRGTASGG